MAKVKTFRIIPGITGGVPDREITEFLKECEEKEIISVQTVYIPPMGDADARLTVIVTKLDDRL